MILLTDIKAYLKIATSNTDFDDFLEALIEVAADWIELKCNQKLREQDVIRYYSGTSERGLMLYEFPISEIKSIYEINYDLNTETLLTLTDYVLYQLNYYCVLNSKYTNFTKGTNNYKLTYTVGYSAEDMPATIKSVCWQLVALLFKDSDQVGGMRGGRLGVDSVSEGVDGMNITTKYKDKLKDFELLLSPFRIPTI